MTCETHGVDRMNKNKQRPDEPLRQCMGSLYASHKIENAVIAKISREQKMQQNREVEIDVSKLKKIRADRAMSQLDLALAANVGDSTISKIESKGERARIRKITLNQIAKALHCNINDLMN